MKRYSNNDNIDIDPTRLLFHNKNNNNNNLLQGFNKPINKLQDDIIINNIKLSKPQPKKKENTYNDEDISLQFHPNGRGNKQLTTLTDKNSITNYNNDKFRLNNMAQELMEKDEDIQKYKNEVYQLQGQMNEIKKAQSQLISHDMENELLKSKLQEQHKLLKELNEVKHNLRKAEINNESSQKTIDLLKKIVHKQHVNMYTTNKKDVYSDSDEDYTDESEESSDESEEEVEDKKKKKYYNHNLKKSLLKKDFSNKMIDKTMITMKVTPKTKITKQFLIKLLLAIKK